MRWFLPLCFILPTLLRVTSFLMVGGVSHMPNEWYRITPFHCDGLIAGVYLAYLFVERPQWFQKSRTLAWICAPLVVVAVLADRFAGGILFETLYTFALAAGFAGWLRLAYDLVWEPVSRIGRILEKIIHAIAIASYSIYLVHTLVMTDLRVFLVDWPRGVVKTTVILIVALGVSVVFYFLVERPSIVTRDRFLSHRKVAKPTVGAL